MVTELYGGIYNRPSYAAGGPFIWVDVYVQGSLMIYGTSRKSFRFWGTVPQRWRFGFSGNALALINVVALRLARLVLGWVTAIRPTWVVC